MNEKGRVAVFLSGRGSNFVSLYRDSLKADANYRIETVICDRKRALGLKKAERFGIPAYYLPPRDFPLRAEYEKRIIEILGEHQIDLICLAGYMRLFGESLLRHYPGRIMNIHPALLPSFPGEHGVRDALEHGVKVSGVTVHFVDKGLDTGPIIIQEAVPVEEEDDEASLHNRVHLAEYRAYPQAIRLFAEGRLVVEGGKVRVLPAGGAVRDAG